MRENIPNLDILTDDGGRTTIQQIITFEELFDHVKMGGIYLCEDTHTSYWGGHGGGFKNQNTFIEFTKNYIDKLNYHHHRITPVDNFTRTCLGITIYDSMVFFRESF